MTGRVLLLAWLVMLVTPVPAGAEYFFSQRGAEKVTKDAAHKKYGYNRYTMGVSCRPQGAASADPGYKYHRWACWWAASDHYNCDNGEYAVGEILIVGNSGAGRYSYKVLHGSYCDRP